MTGFNCIKGFQIFYYTIMPSTTKHHLQSAKQYQQMYCYTLLFWLTRVLVFFGMTSQKESRGISAITLARHVDEVHGRR